MARGGNKETPRVRHDDGNWLQRYKWSGNIREWQKVIERANLIKASARALRAHLWVGRDCGRGKHPRYGLYAEMAEALVLNQVEGWT